MTRFIGVPGTISDRSAAQIKAVVAGMAPVVREFVAKETALLVAENKALAERVAVLESRPLPEKGDPGQVGERGETGVGVAGALIDRSGVLILTLSDGTQRDLGPVVGKDGLDGKDGADGPPGEPGKDGADGFGLVDFDVEPGEDGRTVIMSFTKGDVREEYELKFPVVIDKGVFKAGEEYEPGDGCTWGGSWWIAQRKTSDKPDGPDSGWRLAVKKGRDGRDAK